MTQLRRAMVAAAALLASSCSSGATDLAADPDLATLPPPITAVQPNTPDTTDAGSDTVPAPPSSTDSTAPDTVAASESEASETATGTEPEPDWAEIVHGLLLKQLELQSAPDTGRITELCSDPSPCLDTSDIAGLANSGQRLINAAAPARPDDAILIDTSEDQPWDVATFSILRVTRTVAEVPDDTAIVDADGNVIFNVSLPPGDEPGTAFDTTWTITRATGEWRLFEITT